jgi:hypothetical protein
MFFLFFHNNVLHTNQHVQLSSKSLLLFLRHSSKPTYTDYVTSLEWQMFFFAAEDLIQGEPELIKSCKRLSVTSTNATLWSCWMMGVCELKAKQPNGSQHPCCTGRIGQVCSSSSNVELHLVYSPCCFHFTHPQVLQSVFCNSLFFVFLQLLVCSLPIDIASVWGNGPHRFFQIVYVFFRVAIIIHL